MFYREKKQTLCSFSEQHGKRERERKEKGREREREVRGEKERKKKKRGFLYNESQLPDSLII